MTAGVAGAVASAMRWILPIAMLAACGGARRETVPLQLADAVPDDAAGQAAACAAGNPRGCAAVAMRYYHADGVDRDDAVALAQFARACELGLHEGCAWQGVMIMNGEGTPRDPARALPLLRPACNAEIARACVAIELLRYQGAAGLTRDVPGALHALDERCLADDADACGFLAGLWLQDASLGDDTQALGYARRGCELDGAYACLILAVVAYDGVGVAADHDAGLATYARACELGAGLACATYGASLAEGHGIGEDVTAALAPLRRGCALAEPRACRVLAATRMRDRDGDHEAFAAASRACHLGDQGGCTVLGTCYQGGVGVPADVARANALFARACDEGEGESAAGGCYYLGLNLEAGRGGPADPAEVAARFARACEQGWSEACR